MTSVNLRRWHIQCGVRCALCDSPRPTTAHVLSGCPVAQNLRASESPPATIPPSVMVTPYQPDLVIYNIVTNSISTSVDLSS